MRAAQPINGGSGRRVGIKEFILWVRDWRGQGLSVRKVHELVATQNLPAYEDLLANTAGGQPRLVFDLVEARAWFETRLKRVNPAPLSPRAVPLKRAR